MSFRVRGAMGDDWDPMRSEYESSMTNDEDGGNHDPCRLYVTNIPKELNEEGLRAAFANYGTLTESYMSGDPKKKYGLLSFETQGEAKLAMMKLNNTGPLHLKVTIAYKPKGRNQNNQQGNMRNNKKPFNKYSEQQNHKQYESLPREQDYSKDNVSVSSSTRRGRASMTNGDDNSYELEDMDELDPDLEELDPDLELAMEKLQVQAMKLKLEQKLRDVTVPAQRITMKRSVIPSDDGKFVIRAAANEDGYRRNNGGAGDACLTPPSLQRGGLRTCVQCGKRTDDVCGGCGVTPYCSEACQNRDWPRRHSSVCHNLVKLSDTTPEVAHRNRPAPTQQLRRPRSPARDTRDPQTSTSNNNNNYEKKLPKHNAEAGSRPPLLHETRRERGDNATPAIDNYYSKPATSQGVKPPYNKTNAALKSSTVEYNAPAAVAAPKANVPPPKPTNAVVSPAPVVVETPLSPSKCLLDLLEVGTTFLASVDRAAKDCATNVDGFVCVAMHGDYQESYLSLCEDFLAACEADQQDFSPTPGDLFALFNNADQAWYRARLLNATQAALIDSSSVISTKGARCKRLPQRFAELPEFSCTITLTGVQLGDNVSCTIQSRSSDGRCVVAVTDSASNEARGAAVVARWKPRVEMPQPVVSSPTVVNVPAKPSQPTAVQPAQTRAMQLAQLPAVKPSQAAQSSSGVSVATGGSSPAQAGAKPVPTVSRPPLDVDSKVSIVVVTEEHLVVRPGDSTATRLANLLEQDVAQYGMTAEPLTAPPAAGQTLIAQFTDGLHYRALCKRTSVKMNKYLLEYIEYGNVDTSTLEKLYPCPESLGLQARPALTSLVKLRGLAGTPLTPQAAVYLDSLKGQTALLTIPGDEESVPSGSEVILTLTKTRENVNQKLAELCKPEWKKVEESGADVLSTQVLELSDVEYLSLPATGSKLRILDSGTLSAGCIAVYPASAEAHALHILGPLNERLAQYCESELGRDPYLPRTGEPCIAKFPKDGQWYRAVVIDLPEGAGSPEITVCYLDFGNVCNVPAANLRKMQPEFVRGLPALASTLEIKDFPTDPSPAALQAAREYLKVDADGTGGEFMPESCVETHPGFYIIDSPGLLEAMAGL